MSSSLTGVLPLVSILSSAGGKVGSPPSPSDVLMFSKIKCAKLELRDRTASLGGRTWTLGMALVQALK